MISGEHLTSHPTPKSDSPEVPVIGILGGIGSGKSSVVRNVQGLSLQIIDADRIGHDLLSDPDIQKQIRKSFGEHVFVDAQTIDRSRLAKTVFGDSEDKNTARSTLNQIMHPAIRRKIHSEIDAVSTDVDALILDAALLLEGGWDTTCDWLIFIDTPQELRQQRVRENRNWADDELDRREASQMSIAMKKQRADFIVDNSGSIRDASVQMKQIFDSLLPAA